MNTISNFNNQQIYPIHNKQTNNNVQFKGFNVRLNTSLLAKDSLKKNPLIEIHTNMANIIGVEPKTIINMTKGASTKRLHFLQAMVEKYNSKNFILETQNKENPQHIINIFKLVKKPSNAHIALIDESKIPFKNLEKIFKKVGNDKKRANLAWSVIDDVAPQIISTNKKEAEAKLITELLESRHVDEYSKQFKRYEDYFKLNAEKPNAIKDLDKMVETKTYDPQKYNIELKIRNMFDNENFAETKIYNKNLLRQHGNKERMEFVSIFEEYVGISTKSLNAGNDKDLQQMFLSTTKANLKIRKNIMERLPYNKLANLRNENYNENIGELNKLFQKIDEDKHAANYIKQIVKQGYTINLNKTNNILENVPTKKLDIYFDNAQNIIEQTEKEELISTLNKEIENPFYLSMDRKQAIQESREYGLKAGDTILQKAGKFVKNQFNKLRFALTPDAKPATKTPVYETKPIETITQPIIETKPLVNSVTEKVAIGIKPIVESPKSEKVSEFKPITLKPLKEILNGGKKFEFKIDSKYTKPIQTNSLFQIKQQNYLPAPTLEVMKAEIVTKRTVNKVPNAKKFAVINDVNNIIEKKLGTKTLSEQKQGYAKKATKMRLSMLPEIFESIKDTRKADKLVGKKKSLSSNKDALELYELINGKNKKLVNYMLKKRNVDGTRQFEVKDIINTLKKAESHVAKAKQTNPSYKSADAKEYYNHLHESFMSSYGKPSRTTKK